ncbi:MAG: steryl acetyl hydrolase [Alphaproteobacteria bacterium]|nr:MAG: steryl acetyl hydrolase [Alphaproteobacteria bacterium]
MKNSPSPELQAWVARVRDAFHQGRSAASLEPVSRVQRLRDLLDTPVSEPVSGVEVRPLEVAGRPAEWLVPEGASDKARLLFIHGGFFLAGGFGLYRQPAMRLAKAAGLPVLLIDYRLAPENPFPQGLDDCVASFEWLMENGPEGASTAEDLFIAGDSAGGNLTFATLLRLRDEGKRLPDGAITMSPATDLAFTTDDWKQYIETDVAIGPFVAPLASLPLTPEVVASTSPYLQGADALHPYASPGFGDFKDLPPIYCMASALETLRPDAELAEWRAREAGVPFRLELWDHVFHAWPTLSDTMPESIEAFRRMARFIKGEQYKKLARDRFTEGRDLTEVMAENARANPDHLAVVLGEQRLTWAEFDKRLNKVANALIKLGIQPGDKVAALSGTSIEYMEIVFGTLRAGACIVPLSSMASSEALAMMVNDSDAKVFFLSDSYRSLIEPVEAGLTGLVAGGKVAIDFEKPGWVDYHALVEPAPDENPNVSIDPKSGFNIIYSSGTTGVPKGILHSRHMRAQEYPAASATGFSPYSVSLVSTPLYSNTTMAGLLPAMAHGGAAVLMSKFNAEEFLALAEAHQVTHAMLVPVQYQRIMDLENFGDYDLSTFEMKYSTSAPLREDLKRDILDRWPGGLIEYYGLTEGGVTCIMMAHLFPDKLHTVGFPVPGCEIKIMDEEGRELPQGEVGEVVGRSRAMMDGYYKAKDKTSESSYYDAEGNRWHRSGDMGRFDKEGFLELLDRKKDMIISGGFNVFAADLEAVLIKHPEVKDVAVIGIPSREWGETPLALVVAGAGADPEALREWANERLGKGQRISKVELREDLPRSQIGKVLKRELREPYWEGVGKGVN